MERETEGSDTSILSRRLIIEMTSFLGDRSVEALDGAVVEAKRQFVIETTRERRNKLAKLFCSYMEIFRSVQCSKIVWEEINDMQHDVFDRVINMDITQGNIPFAPVITRPYMGVHGLMSMVRNGEDVGYTHFNPNDIVDDEKVPKRIYFIYNIEPGLATLGMLPTVARDLINDQGRFFHTSDEDIALCILYPKLLPDHSLLSLGSRRESTDDIIGIYLNGSGPRLEVFDHDFSEKRFGFASCSMRA